MISKHVLQHIRLHRSIKPPDLFCINRTKNLHFDTLSCLLTEQFCTDLAFTLKKTILLFHPQFRAKIFKNKLLSHGTLIFHAFSSGYQKNGLHQSLYGGTQRRTQGKKLSPSQKWLRDLPLAASIHSVFGMKYAKEYARR